MSYGTNYVLFIDESGKSKLSDDGSHFLLSGVIIDKNLHSALSSYMVSLKEKSDISPSENIHAFNLFEDERVRNRRVSYGKINKFFSRLSSLIEGADIQCIVLRIDKRPFRGLVARTAHKKGVSDRALLNHLKRKDHHDFLYEALARKMILEFGRFLETEDAQGEIVAESRRQDDEAVLRAFISATSESTFEEDSHCRAWAMNSFRRIHSLTFQNKKGLSFGLEIADLFGWAHYNSKYGRKHPVGSRAKSTRIQKRIQSAEQMLLSLSNKKPEDITRTKLKTIAADRVSEFTEALNEYRGPSGSSGTLPGNPDRP